MGEHMRQHAAAQTGGSGSSAHRLGGLGSTPQPPGRTCDAQHHAAQLHPAVVAVAQQKGKPESGAERLQDGRVPVHDVVQPNACACRQLDPAPRICALRRRVIATISILDKHEHQDATLQGIKSMIRCQRSHPDRRHLSVPQFSSSQTTTTGENREPTKPVPNCWMRNSVAMMATAMPTILAAHAGDAQ